MATAEEKLAALRALGRHDVLTYEDGSVVIWELHTPYRETWGKNWDDCLERLARRSRQAARKAPETAA